VFARQQIRFRLDEKGADLQSEAVADFFGSSPRMFIFREPFLVLLLRRGAERPYLALWIANAEWLEPVPLEPSVDEPARSST